MILSTAQMKSTLWRLLILTGMGLTSGIIVSKCTTDDSSGNKIATLIIKPQNNSSETVGIQKQFPASESTTSIVIYLSLDKHSPCTENVAGSFKIRNKAGAACSFTYEWNIDESKLSVELNPSATKRELHVEALNYSVDYQAVFEVQLSNQFMLQFRDSHNSNVIVKNSNEACVDVVGTTTTFDFLTNEDKECGILYKFKDGYETTDLTADTILCPIDNAELSNVEKRDVVNSIKDTGGDVIKNIKDTGADTVVEVQEGQFTIKTIMVGVGCIVSVLILIIGVCCCCLLCKKKQPTE